MSNATSVITFLFLLILSACQVKETASSGGLISGHTPTTNKFTVTPPDNKVYVEGEVLRFKLSFPFDIHNDFSGGEPILKIQLGGNSRDALFTSAPNPRELVFEYTIANNDNAPYGTEIISLNLNGSLLQFLKEGVLVNCDPGSIKPTSYPQIKVDTEKPRVTQLMLTSAPGLYHTGDELLFSLTMSERVHVTGTPTFNFTLSGKSVSASYLSGNNSQLLVFSYTVTGTDFDTNGFDSVASTLSLSSATVEDAIGNQVVPSLPALTTITGLPSSAYQILGEVPHLLSVKLPADGIYEVAKTLDFEFEFDRPVNVTGIPKYLITIGSGASKTTRDVNYISGTGTNKLIFSYVTVPGDVDIDGIEVSTSITQSGSDIRAVTGGRSFFTPAPNNSFTPPDSQGIILKSLLPQAISVSRNGDSTYSRKNNTVDDVWIIGQRLTITVNFNTEMIVIPAPPNVPLLEFYVGGIKKQATYLSGGDGQTALIFQYDIQEGDYDVSGEILLGNIVLNNALITDRLNTIADLKLPAGSKLAATRIDGIRPTIKKINSPPNKTYSVNSTGMIFSFDWSEEVYLGGATGLGLRMDVGGATLTSTTTQPNGTIVSSFPQPNLNLRNDDDGIMLLSPLYTTGKVYDIAGNEALDLTFTPPDTSGILVDTKRPSVLSVIPLTPNGLYKEGDEVFIEVTFDENVEVVLNGTNNYLSMEVGASSRILTPVITKTATTHTFKYTVQVGDNGIFKIGNAFSWEIQDLGFNTLNTFPPPPSTPGILIDTTAPTIDGSSGTVAAQTLVEGDVFEISLTFSENVFVTGTPSIPVNFNGGENDFIYTSGSGTDTLKFQRAITENHFNMTGLSNNISTLNLNGGSIKDEVGHSAPTTFSSKRIDLSGVKITYEEVKLWVGTDFMNKAKSGFSITNEGGVSTEAISGSLYREFNDNDNIRFNASQSLDAHVFMAFKASSIEEDIDIMGQNIQLIYKFDDDRYELTPSASPINKSELKIIHIQKTIHFTSNEKMFGTNFNGSVGEIIIIDENIHPDKLSKIQNYLNHQF